MRLEGRKTESIARIFPMALGGLMILAGAAVYLQRTSPYSQLPMPPGLPSSPDATIGLLFVGIGVFFMVIGFLILILD